MLNNVFRLYNYDKVNLTYKKYENILKINYEIMGGEPGLSKSAENNSTVIDKQKFEVPTEPMNKPDKQKALLDKIATLASIEKSFLQMIESNPEFAKKIGEFNVENLDITKSRTGNFLLNTDSKKSDFPELILDNQGDIICNLRDVYKSKYFGELKNILNIEEISNNGNYSYKLNGKEISLEKAFIVMNIELERINEEISKNKNDYLRFLGRKEEDITMEEGYFIRDIYSHRRTHKDNPSKGDLEAIFGVPYGEYEWIQDEIKDIDSKFSDNFSTFLKENNIRLIGIYATNSTRLGADVEYKFSDGKNLKVYNSTADNYSHKTDDTKNLVNGLKKLYNLN